MSKVNRARTAVPTAMVAVALAALAAPSAGADTLVHLANGKALGDGITIIKTRETAVISPSMAANGAGRTAWVSGKSKVLAPGIDKREAGPNNGPRGEDAMPGSNGTSTSGAAASYSVGYVVGCQVGVGQMALGFAGNAGLTGGNKLDLPSGKLLFNVPLTPGKVSYILLEKKQLEEPGTYYFNWRKAGLEVSGCAGYAQARSFVVVEATGDNHRKVSLYGQRFSLG